LGSTYGTFGGKTDYFSRKEREGKPYEHEKPNVKTNPPKKGTGYGYPQVGLEKYPEYKGDKYNATDLKAKVIVFFFNSEFLSLLYLYIFILKLTGRI